ncbi:MAG: peptide chain release factor 2 [Brevibacterium sp.]|uniref:peptide chain release factor 2 n=1 Tax=Brevibacterium sp. TaxID=1701 RepID=UPI002647FD10|nr:peptide chain release factor 2 [Brevibacterium sp.]MDN5834980.1 peptide chain release factor 2 [Brevibacterium sp.]MDN6134689.1 peptide chain release factor 2 [Brevibacterium sp.]MDN6158784.1 peptide chain release factor 2 [Brevibacterium sp.]MDN6176371.1 peptide chain release factor 2 [Brevibacterium sp.]MDN6192973.1 peptide chain release factor 2 [Brevibacterium sp.]
MATDYSAEIANLRQTYKAILDVSDLDTLRSEVAEMTEQASAPSFWDDPDSAQKISATLAHKQGTLEKLEKFGERIDDAELLIQMSEDEGDEDSKVEAERDLKKLHDQLAELEISTLLSHEYDERSAVVTVRSGAGGDDATDWAQMLIRMYIRWGENRGYNVQQLDTSYAEGAGIKSATIQVNAPYAYGTLSVEAGTHRLVRISPFDNQGRRQTSFAAVEVIPLIESTDHVEIDENDLRIDVYRSSGPGGQSVNTTDSAVRITHAPTGVVVSMQNEKSQIQNREAAMRVLQSRLLDLKRQEEAAEKKELAGDIKASWGDQMRSYVTHPYQMVKDLRTGYEVNNPSAVFDGDLDGLIEAGIRWRKEQEIAQEAQ